MKRLYLLLTLLLPLFGAVHAQDEVTIKVDKTTGDWLYANPARTWASQWQTNDDVTPAILIRESSNNNGGNGANNMAYWDGTNIEFFNCIGGNGTSDTYKISVSDGYEFVSLSLDFVASAADEGVYISAYGYESDVNNSTSEPVHFEVTDFAPETTEFDFIVGANTASKFALTSEFYITVRPMDPLNAALAGLYTIVDQYSIYTQSEGTQPFVVGSEPGNYDAEAVAAFDAAIATAHTLEDKAGLTVEDVEAAKKAIVDAYEAVLATKAPMSLSDGYYRFRTAINYNDGNEKYMYVTPNLGGYWGTIEDLSIDCPSLFKITNAGDGLYDIVSMSTDARFGAGGYANLSAESTELMAFDPVMTINGETYVQIRAASLESGTMYIHQAGHSSGAGTGSNLTGWYATYPTTLENQMGASEWVIVPVSSSEAEAAITAYEPIRQQAILTAAYTELKTAATNELLESKELKYVALLTEADQISSPYTSTAEGSIAALIDNSSSTYWHSDYSSSPGPHVHYLQVALHEGGYGELQLSMTRRNGAANDHITQWGVFGSNDPEAADEEWVELASIDMPFANNTETKTGQFDSKGYQYLRFYIDDTTTKTLDAEDGSKVSRGFGHCSEFQLYQIEVPETSQYSIIGQPAKALEATLSEQAEVNAAEVTQAEYDALKAAYDAFKAQFVDPTELRELIAKAENLANGVVVGSAPGAWADNSLATQIMQTVESAKAYDDAKIYKLATSQEYINTLTSQIESLFETANKIQEGKWYRIHFGSKEVFEANGWDTATNDATESYGIVTNDALWDKYLTAARLEQTTETTTNDDGEDVNVTVNNIMALEFDEDLVRGVQLFFDDDADIVMRDLSLFRFINVGDSAYVIQNKATGLFLRGENTTLDVIPSVFNVSPLGYGQNLIAAKNLISGASQNNLHAQRAQNRLVTWSENIAGSRSGLYIEEVEDVASSYDGTEFQMNLKPGAISTHCFPVDIHMNDGFIYDVVGVEDGTVKLLEIQEVQAGRPFVYIAEGTYDAEASVEPFTFWHGYSFTKDALKATYLKGTYSTINSLYRGAIGVKDGIFEVSTSAVMSSISVPAYTAYIQRSENFPFVDYTYEIVEGEDGVEAAMQQVSRTGDIYSIDGRLVGRGNLNSLRTLGSGVYIVNGVKVVKK